MAARRAGKGLSGRYPPALERVVAALMRLPGVGLRAAERMALHLLETSRQERLELVRAISALERDVRFCSECGALTEKELCRVCSNPKRRRDLICVVEWPHEAARLEEAGGYDGLFHVLMGHLDPEAGIGPDKLRIEELMRRVERGRVREVVLALNPTFEGDATASFLAGMLKSRGVRVSRLARGVPFGSELEYVRPESLRHALLRREEVE